MKLKAARLQKGFTAIELLVVIIVGIALFIWAANNIDNLFGNSDTTEEIRNIQNILVNTKGIKTSSGYGAAGSNLVPGLIAVNGIPKNMSVVAGVPYNPWGGAVTVVSNGATFTISETAQLSQEVCVKMATKISKGGNFATTSINGGAAVAGEVSSATATTQCSDPTNNNIAWTSAS